MITCVGTIHVKKKSPEPRARSWVPILISLPPKDNHLSYCFNNHIHTFLYSFISAASIRKHYRFNYFAFGFYINIIFHCDSFRLLFGPTVH